MKLLHTEELFVIEYLKNGQNGTKTCFTIRADVTERSAYVCADCLKSLL